jgi:hypothetical protein
MASGLMTFSVAGASGSMKEIVVTAHSTKTGKTYTYTDDTSTSDGYFCYNTTSYGMGNCIIFGDVKKQSVPQFDADDVIEITVSYKDATEQDRPVEVHYTISYMGTSTSTSTNTTWTSWNNAGSANSAANSESSESIDTTVLLAAGAVVVLGGLYLADRYLPIREIAGQVTNERNAAVAGATVVLQQYGRTVQTTTTDATGNFRMNVAKGTYQLVVEYTEGGTKYRETATVTAPLNQKLFITGRTVARG